MSGGRRLAAGHQVLRFVFGLLGIETGVSQPTNISNLGKPARSVHTFSSRNFTRDVAAAKRAAANGPVFITDRGRPAFALLRIEQYHRLSGKTGETFCDAMGVIPGGDSIEFDPPRMNFVSQTVNFD